MKCILMSWILLFSCFHLEAQNNSSGIGSLFLEKCTSLYKDQYTITNKKDVTDAKQLETEPSYAKIRNAGLKRVTMLIFTYSTKTKQKFKKSFKVLVYQYTNKELTVQKFSELEKVKQTQDESVFSKSNNYVFLEDSYIFRLEAGCYYSGKEWESLKEKFTDAKISVNGKKIERSIECICGGICK